MKSGKRKNIILVILIILVISIIFFMYKDNKIYKEKVDNNKVTFAIMVEKARDKYVEYRSKEWPKYGYRYAYAKCVDKNKNEIGDLITFDARTDTAIMKSNKSSFCTLYFAIDKELPGIVNETFYIGKTKEQEYTNNQREEIHITLKEDTISNTIDVIEYCLVSDQNKGKCEWKALPELDEHNSFVVTDYDLGSGDGEKTVYLYLKDGAKNISEPVEDSITLDTVAPSCRLWGESTTWINSDRTITYGCSDDSSGCKKEQIDNQTFTTTAKTGIIKNYTIEDIAGNTNNCSGLSANVYVDKTAPSCTNDGDSTNWTNGDRTIWWGCSDSHSRCNTSYSGGSKKYTETTKTANISSYEIRDNAGNVTTCPVRTANVYVDKTAPSCSIGGNPSSWQKTNATLTQNGIDSGEGTVYYSWDNKNSYSTTKSNKSVGTNGSYTLYVKDGVGNENSCNVTVSKIDKTPPSCSIGGNPSSWQKTNAILTQSGTDSEEGTVYYSWDNKNSYSTTKSNKSVGSNGTYILYVKDGVGNENSCNVTVSKIDKTAPTCGNLSITSATTNGLNGNVSCIDNTGGSGCSSSSTSFNNLSTSSSKTVIEDIAGNTTSCTINISGKTVAYCSNGYTLSNSKCIYTVDATEVGGCPSGYTENPNSSGNTRCYKDVGAPSYSYSCSFSFVTGGLRWPMEENVTRGWHTGEYQCWYYIWNVSNYGYYCSPSYGYYEGLGQWLFNDYTYHPEARQNCVFQAIRSSYCSSGSESGGRCYVYSAKTATTYECSNGTYDSSVGKCVVSVDPSYRCPDNYTEYNNSGYCYKKEW